MTEPAIHVFHDVNPATGRITTPGKFEGELEYMLDAYDIYLDGFHDDDTDGVITVTMPDGRTVAFTVTDDGFVTELEVPA